MTRLKILFAATRQYHIFTGQERTLVIDTTPSIHRSICAWVSYPDMTSVPGDIECVGQNSPFLPAFALSLAAHGSKLMYHKSSEACLRSVLGGAAVVVHEDYPRSYSKIQCGQNFFFLFHPRHRASPALSLTGLLASNTFIYYKLGESAHTRKPLVGTAVVVPCANIYFFLFFALSLTGVLASNTFMYYKLGESAHTRKPLVATVVVVPCANIYFLLFFALSLACGILAEYKHGTAGK